MTPTKLEPDNHNPEGLNSQTFDDEQLLRQGRITIELLRERKRQHAKWGFQTPPSVSVEGEDIVKLCKYYRIPDDDLATRMCNEAFGKGEGTFAHIALEEFSEAICACSEAHRRDELVQLGAVVMAWIEAIDFADGK